MTKTNTDHLDDDGPKHALRSFASCVWESGDIIETRLLPGGSQAWHTAASLPEAVPNLMLANERGLNVFAGINPRNRSGGSKAADVALARCLFADFDGVDLDEARRRWKSAGLPEPTIIISSGHGIHAYWRLIEPLADLVRWTALQKGIIRLLDSDPSIHDPPRIMRLPGFLNVKREPHVPCEIESADPSRRYDLNDLQVVLKAESPTSDTLAAPSSSSDPSVLMRAAAYMESVPPEAEGARNSTAYRLACVLTNDFSLPDEAAWPLLEKWNQDNHPPLGEAELRKVLIDAREYSKRPVGNKLNAPPSGDTALTALTAYPVPPENEWPDALDGAAYHGSLGDIVRLIEPHSESDPAAILIQLLVSFGSIVGRKAHFVAEADRHFGNLFVVLVGSTSKGRKGSSWGHACQVLQSVDDEWTKDRVMSGLSSGEGLIWQVRDPIRKSERIREGNQVRYVQVEADPGVTDKRALILESEFASTLRVVGRDGNTLSPTIRQAWDKGSLQTMTKNSPARATGAHISIIGHITRDELRRYLTNTEAGNGFGNRFLWLCVRRSKALPEGGRLHEVNFDPLVDQLKRAVMFAAETRQMQRDDAAREVWAAVYPELSEGKAGLLGAVTSRAEAQTMRLAVLYALLDQSPVIRPEHLMAGLAVWEYCERSARYIFGSALGDPTADEIVRAVRARPDGMSRNELRDHFQRNKSADEIARALNVLLEHRMIRFEHRDDTGGRPAEVYFLTGH